MESICTVLTCLCEEYNSWYHNEKLLTEVLSHDAQHSVITPNTTRLRAASNQYRLDHLLLAMLNHAPHASGTRYVAICLHIANQKGEDGVVNAAKAWFDNLFFPSLLNSVRLSFSLRLLTRGLRLSVDDIQESQD